MSANTLVSSCMDFSVASWYWASLARSSVKFINNLLSKTPAFLNNFLFPSTVHDKSYVYTAEEQEGRLTNERIYIYLKSCCREVRVNSTPMKDNL